MESQNYKYSLVVFTEGSNEHMVPQDQEVIRCCCSKLSRKSTHFSTTRSFKLRNIPSLPPGFISFHLIFRQTNDPFGLPSAQGFCSCPQRELIEASQAQYLISEASMMNDAGSVIGEYKWSKVRKMALIIWISKIFKCVMLEIWVLK
ncbi:hypothetical protein AMTRI_Chr12g274450 [Amborella trichopoda]